MKRLLSVLVLLAAASAVSADDAILGKILRGDTLTVRESRSVEVPSLKPGIGVTETLEPFG